MHFRWAIILALSARFGLVNAISHDVLRHNEFMASQNLLPDGTPMEVSAEVAEMAHRLQSQYSSKSQKKIDAEYVRLPVDHWNRLAGTFNNRFWASESYYTPGGPVFIYDGGEGNADGLDRSVLQDPKSFFAQLLKQFHGIGIVWEHRYYGNSTPVEISLETPATAFKHLSTEQALADVPAFAWNFSRPSYPNQDLTPGSTPWVFVGGSYPGMRAAFMRQVYPETIFASWASSAPVQASIDMSFYFEPIWRGLNAYGWGNCTVDIQAAVQEMDRRMALPLTSFALKERFLGPGGGINTNAGFADALASVLGNWQSYGVNGGNDSVGSFCNWISTDPATNTPSGAGGWASVKGAQFTLDRWASWPAWIPTVNSNLKTNCTGRPGTVQNVTSTESLKCDLQARNPDPDAISWGWQYCTQWGFFQSTNFGSHQLGSRYNTLEHQHDVCHRQFPDGRESGLLPEWPDVVEANKRYGGWNMRPSNTFWTAGMFDPWRTLSTLSDMPFSPNTKPEQTIPDCGAVAGPANSLFGALIPNAEHCFDFRSSFNGSLPARRLFDDALTKWLGCYKPTGHNRTIANARYPTDTRIRRVEYP